MSKRVVFKDGHEENAYVVKKYSDGEELKTEFVTKSGQYLCSRRGGLADFYKLCSFHESYSNWIKTDDIRYIELGNEKLIKSARPSVDDYYLNIAKAVCKRSTCMRRHYGAVIVKNGEIISTGYNGSPRGEDNCCDTGVCGREGNAHNDGDYRKCPAVHAEMNALLSAARKDTIGATLYLYGEDADGSVIDASPCPICDALIHNAGLEKVVASNTNWSCD